MQNQQPGQNPQWFNKQQPIQQNQQQIILQRQGMGMQNMQGFGPGPSGNFMARPRQQMAGELITKFYGIVSMFPPFHLKTQLMMKSSLHFKGMNQQYQNVFNNDQQQNQGMKMNQPHQPGTVLAQQLQGGMQQLPSGVMGPPSSIQQQLLQTVRSPPPIPSPQSIQSPRAAPSPGRPLQSPHHLPSQSPVPDMHGHLVHPHQSPLPANSMNDNVLGDNPMTAQEQLSKFVDKL